MSLSLGSYTLTSQEINQGCLLTWLSNSWFPFWFPQSSHFSYPLLLSYLLTSPTEMPFPSSLGRIPSIRTMGPPNPFLPSLPSLLFFSLSASSSFPCPFYVLLWVSYNSWRSGMVLPTPPPTHWISHEVGHPFPGLFPPINIRIISYDHCSLLHPSVFDFQTFSLIAFPVGLLIILLKDTENFEE